jgi:hypothetical protein
VNLLTTIKTSAGTVLHVIEAPFEDIGKIAAILKTGVADEPEVKAGVVQLVSLGEKAFGDGSTAVAGKGLNIFADEATIADIQAFGTYFTSTFIPMVKNVYGEVVADLNAPAVTPAPALPAPPAPAPTPEAVANVVQTGPGLPAVSPA